MSEFLVESRNRNFGTATDFQIQLRRPLRAKEVALLQANIPNTVYNVSSSNNLIRFNDGSARIATVAPGIYTAFSLKGAVETAFVASGTSLTFTFTYVPSTLKVTIAATGPFSLSFLDTTNSMANILGFEDSNTASAASHSGTKVVNLITPPLLLTLDFADTNVYCTSEFSGTFVIPVNAEGGYLMQFQQSDFAQKTEVSQTDIQNFRVRLTTTNNAPVDLNGSEWNFLLRVTL
jgi:hypothetical protein